MVENIKIRKAEPKDVTIILNLIKELAEYEKLLDEVTATEDKLMNTIFGKDKFVEVWLAEINDEPVAMKVAHSGDGTMGLMFVRQPKLGVKPG